MRPNSWGLHLVIVDGSCTSQRNRDKFKEVREGFWHELLHAENRSRFSLTNHITHKKGCHLATCWTTAAACSSDKNLNNSLFWQRSCCTFGKSIGCTRGILHPIDVAWKKNQFLQHISSCFTPTPSHFTSRQTNPRYIYIYIYN